MAPISRRRFAAMLPALPAMLAGARRWTPAAQPAALFRWHEVSPRVRAVHGNGGNVMHVADGGTSMLVDSKSVGFGAALRREAERLAGTPRWLVLTHHHFDHAGGAGAFTSDVTTIGHEDASRRVFARAQRFSADLEAADAAWVERYLQGLRSFTEVKVDEQTRRELEGLVGRPAKLVPESLAPTVTMDATMELTVGGVAVELHHVGPGHTDNDVWVLLPGENVLHTGDLVFRGRHPFIDVAGGATTVGWQRSLRAMMERSDARTAVVPGHGDVGDRRALQEQSDYFDRLREVVSAAIREGRTREEVTKLEPASIPELDPGGRATNLGVVFDELSARR